MRTNVLETEQFGDTDEREIVFVEGKEGKAISDAPVSRDLQHHSSRHRKHVPKAQTHPSLICLSLPLSLLSSSVRVHHSDRTSFPRAYWDESGCMLSQTVTKGNCFCNTSCSEEVGPLQFSSWCGYVKNRPEGKQHWTHYSHHCDT
ncbi:unnamed protein product [Leuciscus chuanchicus]